ncbi:MAG: hypothetical protein LBT96_00305 [Campylobacteraceae bacterium]|jgi:hypothetical protein|nr:hypothetical protein [Campylobacteraceae bacterium]
MYSKRVFKVLATLFVSLVLTSCGEGNSNEKENTNSSNSEKSKNSSNGAKSKSTPSVKGALTSVNEWDYFPKFDVQADGVSHSITRFYKSEAEQIDDINTFKNKGNYTENSASVSFYRIYPLGKNRAIDIASVHPRMIRVNGYETMINISGIHDETIVRDNALFEKIFGYKGGTLVSVFGVKYFKRNITAKLQQYAVLLEQQGFKKSGTRQWRKVDSDNNRMYTWNYDTLDTNGIAKQTNVHWNVWLTDNYCKI